MKRKIVVRFLLCWALAVPLCAAASFALAQDEGAPGREEDQRTPAAPADQGAPAEAAAPAPPAGPQMRQAGGAHQGFRVLPTVKNTYVVTSAVRGLRCVVGVGSDDSCAVTDQSADEGGPPWDRVKCRPGDESMDTYARSLDDKREIRIFEAPPALASASETRPIDVRLGRVCVKAASAKKARQ